MRLSSIGLTDVVPVRRFEVTGLSDLVVIAGPNGVGKSRLMQAIMDRLRGQVFPGTTGELVATCSEERDQWAKPSLDLSNPQDVQLLAAMLSAGVRKRTHLQSTLLNFESDRTIQNVPLLQFSWDMPDPSEEGIGWDLTFQPLKARYQDTVHAMHRMVETRRRALGQRAEALIREGKTEMKLESPDPMIPFKRVFAQLLGPKQLADLTMGDQRLRYTQDGQTLDFSSLSSGEREVVNIAFDFLLRGPNDCIVFFDEPELHLHPELSFKLVQTLQGVGSNNQFIFTTHSPDIITASLDRSVIFLGPSVGNDHTGQHPNQAVTVSEGDESNEALKLLGQSIGIVALGRKIVLIEGTNSSLDKQTYGSILKQRFSDLVMVASGGKHTIDSFAHLQDAVLSKSLWGVDFFMLCDGDSRPPSGAVTDGRLQVLPRYHLENYFLDEAVWAQAFTVLVANGSWLLNPLAIRAKLRELARSDVSYAVALKVAASLRLQVGNVSVMPKECRGLEVADLAIKVKARASEEAERVGAALDLADIEQTVRDSYAEIVSSLDQDTDDWKSLIPAKAMLGRFTAAADVKPGHAKKLYVDAAHVSGSQVFADIFAIFERFDAT